MVLASLAQAHPGHPHPFDEVDEFDIPDVAEAFMHPFTGLDHLVAALAVGVLVWMVGRKLGGLVAASFLGAMAIGWGASRAGFHVPMLEQGIALTIAAVGIVVMMQSKVSNLVRMAVVAAMGFWHGGAHGVEMPAVAPALGLLFGTGLAVALGAAVTAMSSRLTPAFARYAGAAAAVVGLVLVVQRLG